MSTTYRIEKREVGWRKYRVTKPESTGGLLVSRRRLVVSEFFTKAGAERFIALRQWTPILAPSAPPATPADVTSADEAAS